jgi:hypothetical protein
LAWRVVKARLKISGHTRLIFKAAGNVATSDFTFIAVNFNGRFIADAIQICVSWIKCPIKYVAFGI